ncbi:MAG TPA: hypothetical protein VED18_05070 [Candidatus Sulfotelmatobacter sp.]|nr:hypothetical protein [Candidatus Sulfotelmatobacter sp.]
MERSAGSGTTKTAFGALAILAMLALAVPSVEARVRISIRSIPKPHPSVPVGRVHAPDAPKVNLKAPAARSISAPLASAAPAKRGIFGRFWDWLRGRKPEVTPAVQVANAAPPPTPAAAPNIVVSIPSARPPAAPAAPAAPPAGQAPEQDARRAAGLGGAAAPAGAAAAAAGSVNPTPAAAQAFGAQGAQRPAPRIYGYILHLTNGRSIAVARYEERGDQVMIPQPGGAYGLPRSSIARIEPREAEPEAAPTRSNAR